MYTRTIKTFEERFSVNSGTFYTCISERGRKTSFHLFKDGNP